MDTQKKERKSIFQLLLLDAQYFLTVALKNWFKLLAVRILSCGCTWEVWRALKKIESCSPNFPSAFITRYAHT